MLTRLRIAFTIAAVAAVFAAHSLAATLPHLRGVGEIRDWFNANTGHVRLLLLLAPT